MTFNSTIFLFVFLPLAVCIHTLLPRTPQKNKWLLFASLFFYGWCNWEGCLFLILYGLFNYGIVRLIYRRPGNKLLLVFGVLADVGILFFFKYFNFSAYVLNRFLGTSISVIHVFQPLGISFVTFTAISFVVDVYRGVAGEIPSLSDFYLYLSLFPKAAQGPITRYSQLSEQLVLRQCSFAKISSGLKRFIIGLGKKCLIADVLGKSADVVFSGIHDGLLPSVAWLGLLYYTFQIFYDFSGYTDMAIGIGQMLGFSLPENFDRPYLSKSVSEFWRRWHMTLGQWFRNYIYIPMGGNRKGTLRTLFNLSVVWFVTGIWHGADLNYILWGMYYGILVMFEKLVSGKTWYLKTPGLLKWAVTFFATIIGWVIFRTSTVSQLTLYLQTMFGLAGIPENAYGIAYFFDFPSLLALGTGILLALPRPKVLTGLTERSTAAYVLNNLWLAIVFIFALVFMVNSSYSAFIYFQF